MGIPSDMKVKVMALLQNMLISFESVQQRGDLLHGLWVHSRVVPPWDILIL